MNLGIFDLVGVIMLVLAGTSFIYLLHIGNKSRSTWMLLWFFLCVILSSCATIVTNIGTAWDYAFAPSQDAFLILGGVFLVRFAYLYPTSDQPREARWVIRFFEILAVVALIYSFGYAIWYFANLPVDHRDPQLYYLLTPIAISLTVFVFFRRSVHFSFQTLVSSDTVLHRNKSAIKFLLKPNNRSSFALRNYGLSLAISLVPALALIEWIALPQLVASFLFNLGAVIAISVLMLTYLSYAPESVSVSAKLVGISLVSVLLILGFAGITLYHTNPGLDEHSLVSTFITLVVISSILIILIFPSFFRTALLDPLAKLLRGVRIANAGDLSVQVPVQYIDEIGFLTQSFNRMISALNEATQALKKESVLLEQQVAERTEELRRSNEQLTSENAERKEAQARVDRQLRYEEALANCSRSLLLIATDDDSQHQVLEQALEHLRVAALASRAYIFHNFDDPDLGLCLGIQAEVCAPNIPAAINNPANQKVPWSQLPKEWFTALEAGNPYGGPVDQAFASTPAYLENFLNQSPPLLSVQTFPIYFNNQWWGFVGYDDCVTPREWDENEILMLRTASEMIENTLGRWAAEKDLRITLEDLERRVYKRTIELSQANAELRHEIHERQRFQEELEDRLEIERTLANISARLLSPLELEVAISETLRDLGAIMQAIRVVFIQLPPGSMGTIADLIEWNSYAAPPLSNYSEKSVLATSSWFGGILDNRKSIYIEDLSTHPGVALAEVEMLAGSDAKALLLTPLLLDNQLAGAIVCSNPKLPKSKILENIQLVEVVAGLLGSLLRREVLLNTLERRVAARTDELATFFDLTLLTSQAGKLTDLIENAMPRILEVTRSRAICIHLIDPDRSSLSLAAQQNLMSNIPTRLVTGDLPPDFQSWLWQANDPLVTTDLPRLMTLPPELRLSDYQTYLGAQIRIGNRTEGILSCYRFTDSGYSIDEIALVMALAEQIGIMLENHRLRQKAEEIAVLHERQRLARDLHDSVTQSLYSMSLFSRAGSEAAEDGDMDRLKYSLTELERNTLHTLREMRLLLYELRPADLEQGGVIPAIQTRLNTVERRAGLQLDIQLVEPTDLPPSYEVELYHIIIEALNNVVKHAAATRLTLQLIQAEGRLDLRIADNGRGFDPTQTKGGMGLRNIQERVARLNGELHISSEPGGGTRLEAVIPYPAEEVR